MWKALSSMALLVRFNFQQSHEVSRWVHKYSTVLFSFFFDYYYWFFNNCSSNGLVNKHPLFFLSILLFVSWSLGVQWIIDAGSREGFFLASFWNKIQIRKMVFIFCTLKAVWHKWVIHWMYCSIEVFKCINKNVQKQDIFAKCSAPWLLKVR